MAARPTGAARSRVTTARPPDLNRNNLKGAVRYGRPYSESNLMIYDEDGNATWLTASIDLNEDVHEVARRVISATVEAVNELLRDKSVYLEAELKSDSKTWDAQYRLTLKGY